MDGTDQAQAAQADAGAWHPLDPLRPAEIAAAAEIVRGAHPDVRELRFETIELAEPRKDVVRGFVPGDPIERQARFVAYARGATGVWRGLVSLDQGRVVEETFLADAKPMISPEEFFEIELAVKADPRFQAALARRGVSDQDLVCVDPWSAGNFDVAGEAGRRIAHTFVWMRARAGDNYYAHPIEGLNGVVDIDTGEVLRIDDYYADTAPMAVPMGESNYTADMMDGFKPEPAALDVVQPNGPGFRVTGNLIEWEGFDVRVGFNGREGLVLHRLGYTENGVRRPILYRASLTEMVVPYGAPVRAHHRKNVFDIGEYGLGKLANALELGCDCLGAIHYFDAYVNDITGAPRLIKNAICLHEEDYGIGWKHWDWRTDHAEVRRMRRLVISSISTVGNYEYGSYWYLYQDGIIEFEMKATGIINTVGCEPGKPSRYGTEVSPGVEGQIHQHVFCARLDTELDGPSNRVLECDTVAMQPGPDNPYGNAFYVQERVLARESEARRKVDFDAMRYWKVQATERTNLMGKPTAYKLEATSAVRPYTHPESPSGKRGQFVYNHLWVTPFAVDERYPAGEFMNHSTGDDGLAAWTAQDRPLDGADLVLWHSFGIHHLPRPEDFPVQPCVTCGFKLHPVGFFDRNPMIDLPPKRNAASCCVGE
ncbi:MAG: primary-amine oxidase [Geminicoccaceae bacterium]|nr:MAG: primary-amine oxidase [Geminicoccaceae bacterium]